MIIRRRGRACPALVALDPGAADLRLNEIPYVPCR
jgi:hypothetical protein